MTCLGYDSAQGAEHPRSILTHLKQENADLETELSRIRSATDKTSNVTSSARKDLVTALTAAVYAPEVGPRRTKGPLQLNSAYFLSSSPVPYLRGRTSNDRTGDKSRELRQRAIALSSIPREVVDIMLKHYCDIYRPQYPAVEEAELYKACDRVYNSPAPSDFDSFCVNITLAISVCGRPLKMYGHFANTARPKH